MKSNKRKTGGSWRRKQIKRSDGMVLPQAKTRAGPASVVGLSLHGKPGKDRTKQTTGAKIEAVVKERAIRQKTSDKEHNDGEKSIFKECATGNSGGIPKR